MTEFRPGLAPCLNCGTPTKGKHNYQGVVVCGNCYALANMCDRRAVKQALDLVKIYRESLRVALASGRLRPGGDLQAGERVRPPTKDDLRAAATKLFDWTRRVNADVEALRHKKAAEDAELDQESEG